MSYVRSNIRTFTEVELLELNPVLTNGEAVLVILEDGSEKVVIGNGNSTYTDLISISDTLKNEIESSISDKLTEVEESLKDKLSINVSPEDAGKVLGIDESGNIIPIAITQDNIEGEISGKSSAFTWGEIYGTDEAADADAYTENLGLKLPGYVSKADIYDINTNFIAIERFSKETQENEAALRESIAGIDSKIESTKTSVLETVTERDGATNLRVDNLLNELTNNPEYAATAEVVDIRSGYDGVLYESAGAAVRSIAADVAEIKENLQTIDPNDLGLVQDETTGIVYPTFKGVQSINGIPLSASGGGGGSGSGISSSVFKFRSTTDTMAFTIAKGNDAIITYTFSSIDVDDGLPTGKGTASYYVNGDLVLNTSIPQGDNSFNCAEYLSVGSNTVTITVSDVDSNKKSLSWEVTVIEITIESTFDYSMIYEDQITFKYTAYGNADKTIHFILDKVEVATASVSSSGKQSTQVFENLDHGLHTIEVYSTAIVNGSKVESNHLKYDAIVVTEGSVTPVISMNYNTETVLQGELIDIPYIVYDPLSTESEVTLNILYLKDDSYVLYKSETYTVNRGIQHWTTRTYPLGTVRFVVVLRDISRSIVVNVEEFELPIESVTNDMELLLSAAGRSNNETSPEHWEYNGITTDFENVNWASSGWVNDENGDTALKLMGGSTATINFKPFSKDLRVYGKTLEFEFAVRDVNNREANVISCLNGGIGFEITADSARLSSAMNEVTCHFRDEKKMRIAFTIESRSEYRMMSIYIDGVLTCSKQYVATDNFQQTSPVNITVGSPYCSVDLYTVRSYSTALSQDELVGNYICDLADITERAEVYDDNDIYNDKKEIIFDKVKKKIPVMTIIGELPPSKGEKKNVLIDYYDPNDPSMNFTGRTCKIDVQGTSSQWYVRKNYKLKFDEKFAHIKGEIATKTYCMKADYAEATSTHNTGIANLAHTLYSEPIPAQEDDSRCRTTIEGFPCVIFHKPSENEEAYFLGKYNYNYDKGSEEAFGFTEDYDVESWEFCNNTSVACNFTGNIPAEYKMTDENNNEIGWVNDFERRYPDHETIDEGPEVPNEAIARFRAMHDWVVSTGSWDLTNSDILNKYRSEFQEIFNLHYILVYYVWTFFFLMVDQRAKNMFMTYWGKTGKWYPYLYDNDTCLGINNEGQMSFDFYHEDTDFLEDGSKVYNGQDSVLWNNFRIAFAPEIQQCYKDLRSSGKLTYDIVHKYFVDLQSDKWSASIYNEDSDFKYISMLRESGDATNLPQIRGTGEHHLEYFLDGRLNYCDSKWYAMDYANDFIVLRVNTPENTTSNVRPNANITVTAFSDMYAGVRYRANGTLQQQRISKNEAFEFIAPADNFNDTETAVYGASQISSLGDLSPLYCNYCDVSKASKLIELKIGNEDSTYESRLETLSLGTNRLLKRLDIRNCKSLKSSVNLSGCPNIEEIFAEGSSITGLDLTDSGYLKTVHLPNTVTVLNIKNQLFINDFQMAGYENIKNLTIENSPRLPISDILLKGTSIERVRLINVEWETTEEELNKVYTILTNCGGIDENGLNVSKSVVSGIVSVPFLSDEMLRKINETFPELMMKVNGVILCTVSYYNMDGSLLYVTTVNQGDSAPDIVEDGTISTPVMPPSELYKYEYSNWSDSLENIQRSRSFVAMYNTFYGVRFYSDDELLYSTYVEYGAFVKDPITSNLISIPEKESSAQYHFSFLEWDSDTSYVTEPILVKAVYSEVLRDYEISFYNEDVLLETISVYYGSIPEYKSTIPEKIGVTYPQDYKFLGWTPELTEVTGPAVYQARFADSDHILDSWQVISSNISNNTYKEKYPIGIMQRITLTDGIVIDAELVDYDTDVSEDGSTAAMTFITKNFYETYAMESDRSIANSASWRDSSMRSHLIEDVLPLIPLDLKGMITPVTKLTSVGGGNTNPLNMISTTDEIWTPALIELVNTRGNNQVYAAEGKTYKLFDLTDEEEAKAARIRRDLSGNAQRYWTRTPVSAVSNEYWVIAPSGDSWNLFASYAQYGVVFGFCIGKTPSK